MKTIIYISTAFLLFISNASLSYENTDYNCISSTMGDKCYKIRHDQDVTPLDAFSNGYWDAITSYSGKVLGDGIIGKAEGIGQDIAKQAIASVAIGLGVPPAVLSLVGLSSGNNGPSLVGQIDQLIQQQTEVLLAAMASNDEKLLSEIKATLSESCEIDTQNMFTASMERLSRWQANTSLSVKKNETQDVRDALDNLAYLRATYGNVNIDQCFWGKHVENFSWFMRLVSIENNMRTSHHNITYTNNDLITTPTDADLKKSSLINNFEITRNSVSGVLSNFEVSRASAHNGKDIDPTDNKSNAWWDDVVLDFNDPEMLIHNENTCEVIEKTDAVKNSKIWNILKWSYDDMNVLSDLRVCDFSSYNQEINVKNNSGVITRKLINHKIKFYITRSVYGDATGWWDEAKAILVADSFESPLQTGDNDVEGLYYSNIVRDNSNIGDVRKGIEWRIQSLFNKLDQTFTNKVFQDHMDFEYTQRLQMAYAPYQEYLNNIWTNANSARPANKLDSELARTSALGLLDVDGLSIQLEISIGTNPRNNDSDEDGFDDGFEYTNRTKGFDPLVQHSFYSDYDSDGATDIDEYTAGTDIFDYEDNPAALADRQRLAAILVPIITLILN